LIHRDFTLYEVVKGNAQVFPDRLAAVDEDRRLTFKQFFDLVNRLAVGLRKEGIKRGDRIAIMSRNNLESFALYFASARCGAILVPINTRLSQGEIEYVLNDCQPKLLFAENSFQPLLGQNTIKIGSVKRRYSVGQKDGDFLNFDPLLS
jgi:acyl-CoA synthetase (AMP-forming)/AMP-acid ligase II